MKLLITAIGPGETSQAYAVAKYCSRQGHTVTLSLVKEINTTFLSHKKTVKTVLTENPESLIKLTREFKPDAILFCNSKIFHRIDSFRLHSPFPSLPVFTLDSNWLFDDTSVKYSFIPWANEYFVNLPKRVFEQGLKENGGYFHINETYKKRIKVVGLVPSYERLSNKVKQKTRQELGIKNDEKLIFCYFSGFGSDSKEWVLFNLIRSIKVLNKKHTDKIKVVWIGTTSDPNKTVSYPWLSSLKQTTIDTETFYRYLSAADLVFQHQGLGTLAQAISANIPVIANVSIQHKKEKAAIHPAEVGPFAKLKICTMLYKSSDTQTINKRVETLLFDKDARQDMQHAQQKNYAQGEQNILESISTYLKQKK